MFEVGENRPLAVVFYVWLLVAYVAVVAGMFPSIVSRNSEGLVGALLVGAALQLVRIDRNVAGSIGWLVFLGAGFTITGPLRDITGWPLSILTLQESFAGVIVVSLYLMWPRDWQHHPGHHRPLGPYYLLLGAAFVAGALNVGGGLLQQHAETLAIGLLVATYFDFVAPGPVWRRMVMYALLIVTPFVYTALNEHGNDVSAAVGVFEVALVYLQRTTEAFVAVLCLALYADADRLVRRRRTADKVMS